MQKLSGIPYRKKLLLLITLLFCLGQLYSCEQKDLDIAKSRWKVKSTKLTQASAIEYSKAEYIMELSNNNKYTLQLDVNQCSGNYNLIIKNGLSFKPVSCTELCCDSMFSVNLVELLPLTKSYILDNDMLTLTGKGVIELVRL